MRSGFTLVELLVVISIIATLAGVGVPVIIAQKKKGDRSEAISNIKQVGLAMFSFEQDYGSYPSSGDNGTGKMVETNTSGATDSAGKITLAYVTSNDMFLQLIKAGFIDGEKSFYAKSSYTKKADGVLTGTGAVGPLSAGECGFSYVMSTDTATPLVSSGNSGQILLFAASNKSTGGAVDNSPQATCEVDVYDKKAVVFRIDNSATAESVSPGNKRIILPGTGTTRYAFDVGADTVWGDGFKLSIMVPKPK